MPKPTPLPPIDAAKSLAAWNAQVRPNHKLAPRVYIKDTAPAAAKAATPVVKAKKVKRK